jgi:hypothetical protein
MALDDLLQRLLDDSRADAGRDSRRRRRVLEALAEESAHLQGTLVDLCERDASLTVRTIDGQNRRGTIRLVATDFVVLATDAGDAWIALRAVEHVRPSPDELHTPATGDRRAHDLLFAEALARVAPDRPEIAVHGASGDAVLGRLRSAGSDLLTLELDGPGRPLCYVSLGSVLSVGFLRSG